MAMAEIAMGGGGGRGASTRTREGGADVCIEQLLAEQHYNLSFLEQHRLAEEQLKA